MRDPDRLRQNLEIFSRGAASRTPSGHAAGVVIAVGPEGVTVDFGLDCSRFRAESFPGVEPGDFVTVGPAVSRWRVGPVGSDRVTVRHVTVPPKEDS